MHRSISLPSQTYPDPEWVIRDTDIYRPLTSDQVAYSPSVSWFVLDVADQRIIQFDLACERVGVVARAGEGPGELNRVQAVFWEAGRLYAVPEDIQGFWG